MGVRFLVLLALLIGVLYSIHLLVRDFQALTAGRLLRMLFKRDVSSQTHPKPNVRWRKILQFDPIQCARFLYCDIGAHPPDTEVRRGFTSMLSLKPRDEDRVAQVEFQKAYQHGKLFGSQRCNNEYPMCPFKASLLFELVQHLLRSKEP